MPCPCILLPSSWALSIVCLVQKLHRIGNKTVQLWQWQAVDKVFAPLWLKPITGPWHTQRHKKASAIATPLVSSARRMHVFTFLRLWMWPRNRQTEQNVMWCNAWGSRLQIFWAFCKLMFHDRKPSVSILHFWQHTPQTTSNNAGFQNAPKDFIMPWGTHNRWRGPCWHALETSI